MHVNFINFCMALVLPLILKFMSCCVYICFECYVSILVQSIRNIASDFKPNYQFICSCHFMWRSFSRFFSGEGMALIYLLKLLSALVDVYF